MNPNREALKLAAPGNNIGAVNNKVVRTSVIDAPKRPEHAKRVEKSELTAKRFKQMYMSKVVRTRAEQVFDLRKDLNSIIDKGGDMSFNAKKRMRGLRVPVSRFAKENTGKLYKPGKASAVRTVPSSEWGTA